jgi:hypothetical protein
MFIEAGLLIKQRCTKPIRGRTGTIFLYGYSNQVTCVRQFADQAFWGSIKSSLEKHSWHLFVSKHLYCYVLFCFKGILAKSGHSSPMPFAGRIKISEHAA